MGDKLLEQAVILTIKDHFFRPMYYQSPIENSFYIVSIFAKLYRFIDIHFVIRAVHWLIWRTATTRCLRTTSTLYSWTSITLTTRCLEWWTQRRTKPALPRLARDSPSLSMRKLRHLIKRRERLSAMMTSRTYTSRLKVRSAWSTISNWTQETRQVISQISLKPEDHLAQLSEMPANANEFIISNDQSPMVTDVEMRIHIVALVQLSALIDKVCDSRKLYEVRLSGPNILASETTTLFKS